MTRFHRAAAAVLCLVLAMSFAGAADLPPRAVTIEDLGKTLWPGAPRLSPDGRQVAYELDGRIHVVDVGGGQPRAITSSGSSASDPRWSRDGRALYFLSDRHDKTSQLWKLPVDSFGEATQLTTFERGIDSLKLSPDETRLLISFSGPVGKKSDEAAKPEPWVIDRLHFKEDAGDGYLTGDRAEHLYVYDLATKALRQVTSGRYSESEGAWSPDGKSIVFTSNRNEEPDAGYESDLWIVAADNTDRGESLRRLTQDAWVKASPQWSPDGQSIAYLTAEDGVYALPQVAVISASGGKPKLLTLPLDRWVSDLRFSANGEWIYFTYEQLGGAHLARVRVRDGRIEKLIEGERHVSAFDVAANGTVAARIETMNAPAEVFAWTKGKPLQLTDHNGEYLQGVLRGHKEKVEFSSPDGTRVEAFVTKPPGYVTGRRYPTVLDIHGGPVGQFAYGYDFSAEYLAAQGYVVVQPNPRGSTGRGQDFVRAIERTWGITDYEDVIAAVDHVTALGIADPERLAVTGYSYGGYMTNTVITRTPRFKAAASGAGHSLIAANYGHDIYQKWYNWELGVPWENEAAYERLSPLRQAGQVQTPTLFLGGRDDWNVPILNAELFYQSLRKRGIDTELVVYPGMHHGGWTEDFEKDRLRRTREWFDKYLGPAPAANAH